MPRSKPEWIGKSPESMPSVAVQLRLFKAQGGVCACPDNCGIVMDFDRDEIDCDHTIPLQEDGENREGNLKLLLRKHHRAKTTAENIARGEERRHKAKAFTTTRARKKSSFQTNRDGPFKMKIDGTIEPRKRNALTQGSK